MKTKESIQQTDASRFYTGNGRYKAPNTSRYQSATYGRESYSHPIERNKQEEGHGTYGVLLFDKRWIAKRSEILARDGNCCVICKGNEKLQVHHRQYHYVKALKQFKAPWDYENRLMVTLCEQCHTRGHSKFRVPNVYL